jgi:hypothetical protein
MHERDEKTFLFGKSEGKRPLWRCRDRWEDNTGLDLTGIGWEGVHGYIWLSIWTSGKFL